MIILVGVFAVSVWTSETVRVRQRRSRSLESSTIDTIRVATGVCGWDYKGDMACGRHGCTGDARV